MHTRIIGTAIATGEHCVSNQALTSVLDTSEEWIRERTGIEQRYYCGKNTATSDLATQAAEKALLAAGVEKEEVDYILVATMTPDYYLPGCGSLVQKKLGMKNIPTLDIRQQCCGFLYGLQVADALLRSGQSKTLLLIGADVHSGFMPWKEWDFLFGLAEQGPSAKDREEYSQFRDRAVLFGDGAGAVVLRADSQASGLLAYTLHTDGNGLEDLYVPSGGTAFRPYINKDHLAEMKHMPVMNGRSVFRTAVTYLPRAIRNVCATQGVEIQDIDMLILHQANLRINEAVQKALRLPSEKVFNNIQIYGNTTAGTIPIAYHQCRQEGRIQPGQLVCFAGLGSGLHWGAVLMRE